MHELYITEQIIKQVVKSLPDNVAPQQVRKIEIEVGKLEAVVAESMTFLFDAIKSNSGLDGANLQIEEIDVHCRCRKCSAEFNVAEPLFLCPACNSGWVDVLQGRGIRLTRIIADDDNNQQD